jgi:peptidoglycan pentaglycine glycine transferase (the first glycine)
MCFIKEHMEAEVVDSSHRDAWDAFVGSSSYGHVLQSWEWGEVKARTGWESTRLALRAGKDVRAAAQILLRSLPYGLGRLAYVPKGPVLDYEDRGALTSMLAMLEGFCSQQGVISLKIEPEVLESSGVVEQLLALGLTKASPVQMRSTIWVDLALSEEEILAKQKQKTRYNTRLAIKRGVTIRPGTDSDLAHWYAMYASTARRDSFSIHGLEYYKIVLEELRTRGLAELLLAEHEGDLLAGIIVFLFGSKAQYMYGASSNEKRNLMAPYLLQWEGMRWAKKHGATVYDLWGIPDRLEENEDLWGVYRHKRGYGGEIVRYVGAFDMVRSRLQHLALERVARPLFKRVARMGV